MSCLISVLYITQLQWGSHASGLASKDELKLEERKPKKKLSLSALTDEDVRFH